MPPAAGGGMLYSHAEDLAEEDTGDEMLLDPPDPMDLLLAHSKEGVEGGPRPLDFVRERLRELKADNAKLRERVQDLEQTLSIVQTAQEWSVGKGMSKEQVDKMEEIKKLLEQAKKAKEEIAAFSSSSKQNLYEKLRTCKMALRKEREEKKEMKERLAEAFKHSKAMKEAIRRIEQQRANERAEWQEVMEGLKQKHLKEMRRLNSGAAAVSTERNQFSEQVIGELTALQQHMQGVKEETVDDVVLQDDSIFESQERWSQEHVSGHLGSADSDDPAGLVP